MPSRKTFTFIDLFAGIGGFRLALEDHGGRCDFTSERDKFCNQTYRANFQTDGHNFLEDIRDRRSVYIPSHDVLAAGFPCQPFSLAGVSKKRSLGQPDGFRCETQGTLFFELAEIIDSHRPAAFILENVKNLRSHDKGNTIAVIRRTLEDELGYEVHMRVIDAKGFVPQHRERIFIVGFREPTEGRLERCPDPFSFERLTLPDPDLLKLASVLHPEDGSEDAEDPYTTGPVGKVSKKYVLTDNLWEYLRNYADKHREKGNGFGYGLVSRKDIARTLSARYYKDGSEILVKRRGGGNPRRLTPRECARLMGFDAPGRPTFRIPVSDNQAYKQFGNAVVPKVVEAVFGLMKPYVRAMSDPILLKKDPRQRSLDI
jgi:DNA (cytosine-5)-methyltransferase 1